MNKYQKALDRIVSTIIEEEADGYWEPRTAGDFCWESKNILQELVERATPKKVGSYKAYTKMPFM